MSNTGYIEYGKGKKTTGKKRVALPEKRRLLGIEKWREGHIILAWVDPKTGKYRTKRVTVPKSAEWVRLRVGKRVVSKAR